MPKLAIMICVKNGGDFLEYQLDSLATQSWKDFDIYIKDNHSNDDSSKIINNFKKKNRSISIFNCEGDNDHFANSYIKLAKDIAGKYDYYAFCDQDDIWLHNHIERGINFLKSSNNNLASMYCSRTILIDENGNKIGKSIFFKKKLSFKNALVQSIAGANTMIFNNAAAKCFDSIKTDRKVISHDWLLYQLISGSNGIIKYSKNASVLYRQHSKNLIGSNIGFKNKIKRLKKLFAGEINKYNRSSLEHLSDFKSLSEKNRHILDDFERSLSGNIIKRCFYIFKSGIYRQTIAGQFMLIINLFIKKNNR
ncbi:MAG: hypothetical protein CMF89_04320 [Candidatus Marinimicrobia bacterium]|nr:hypothetical protein [Candidatus Neomarinimicrobiota bacterium]|tara:strand:- start:562 stop:1485 length:924 start_codon:yes stop_codon:yes gene_type:complete